MEEVFSEELLLELLLSRLFVSGRSRCVSRLLTIESFTVGTLFSNVGAKVNRRSLVRVELKRGGAERVNSSVLAWRLMFLIGLESSPWWCQLPAAPQTFSLQSKSLPTQDS